MASLLKKLRSDIENDRRCLRNKIESARDPALRSTLALLGRLAGKRETSLSVWYSEATVTIQVSEIDSFKVGPLPSLLEKLMDAGVEFTGSTDYAESGNRDFSGRIGPVRVRVSAYLSQASKQCLVKVTGEVTTTRPKYELVCS